jgi:hypothetical protein
MRRLLVLTAALGLSLALAGATQARMMGAGADVGVRSNVDVGASHTATIHSRTGLSARGEVREPGFRPPGWSEGKKKGWHCRVGASTCVPPGLRH